MDAVKQILESLPPLKGKKNPGLAAFLGLVIGGIGIGIYFRSFIDLLIPLAFVIALSVVGRDAGIIGGALSSSFWGYLRAANSNQRLAGTSATTL